MVKVVVIWYTKQYLDIVSVEGLWMEGFLSSGICKFVCLLFFFFNCLS